MKAFVLSGLLALAACGIPPPLIDMRGVDGNAYHRDINECYADTIDPRTGTYRFAMGNPVTSCMERRGYRIISRS